MRRAFIARWKYSATVRITRRGGTSSSCGSNGTTSVVACICTAIAGRMISVRKGRSCRANSRITVLGSAVPGVFASSAMSGGSTMARVLMAARKSASFDSKCLRIAAGVTPSCAAMSASVVAANPRPPKAFRAASRI